MEEFKYKSFKDYINKYPSLLDNYLGSFEDNIEQDFLKIELKKMKELYFSYECLFCTGVPPFKPLDYIPTPKEKEVIEAGVNTTISIKRVIEFLQNKTNNFTQGVFNNEAKSNIIKKSKNENIKSENSLIKHENIFSNDGFILFDHILKEYVKVGRGRFSDIGFFYWSMFNDENKYIHQRPEVFKDWFCRNYENEDIGKIQTYNYLKNIDRVRNYSSALKWFKYNK